ncbi:MAG TPA: hypothetical protein ENF34_04845 [Candidatus Bathyarchaeota archaeon]|nr:hypothetical protein [Candidatus Bathyarchaeota archaeon]
MAERKAKALDIFELLSSCPWGTRAQEHGQKRIRSYEVLGFERVPLLPCKGVVVKLEKPIGDVLPVLFLMNVGRCSYAPEENVLTLRRGGRLIALYPDGRVAIGRAWTEEAARRVMAELLDEINAAYEELAEHGPPSEEEVRRALRLSWRDLMAFLPGTNCGDCGQATCQAFAISVLNGLARLSECPHLRADGKKRDLAKRTLGSRLARLLGL